MSSANQQYGKMELKESSLPNNPTALFLEWLDFASKDEPMGGVCFSLATATKEGKPSSRIVLFKGMEEDGFSFYTNYKSRKAHEMIANPQVCGQFFWANSERQVRIDGKIHKVAASYSDHYFASRPRESQIGAWVSEQSTTIESRSVLVEREEYFTKKFEGMEVPRPEHWGGFVLVPDQIEFWQGRLSRLHDRIVYTLKDGTWTRSRLAP